MDPNELRLGNWVDPDFPMQVVGIYKDQILCNFKGNEADPWDYNPKDLKPILLNDEWRKRLGITYTDWLGSWSTGNGKLGLIKTNNGAFVLENYPSQEFYYVHQIQNIYFDLTGKEL